MQTALYTLAALLLLAALMLLHPHMAVAIWRSPPLHDAALEARLRAISEKAGFRCTGFREWPVKNRSLTAAIVGIAGWSRYVLFSPKLLEISSPEAVGAILAHEIGHWRRRHLLLYPFILMGITGASFLAASLLSSLIVQAFDLSRSSPSLLAVLQAVNFLFLILLMAIFFRVLFGYFSRLFEREADLFPMELGLPVAHVVEALDTLATAGGNIHREPNWHHHSIQERIDFLAAVENDPTLAARHHRLVKISLLIFFAAFAAVLLLLLAVEG